MYWPIAIGKPLFGRCQVLTLNHHQAGDLAQEAWCRVLRTRHALKPGGNFPAYPGNHCNQTSGVTGTGRRGGLDRMAEHQLASLDAVMDAAGW